MNSRLRALAEHVMDTSCFILYLHFERLHLRQFIIYNFEYTIPFHVYDRIINLEHVLNNGSVFFVHLDSRYDAMALWLATVIIFAIAIIWLNAKVLRIAGKLLKSNTEISALKTTVEESVKSIDRTLYSILDEMGQSSTPSLAARWSVNPPVNSCIINMVNDWLDKAGSNGPVKARKS